LDEDMPLGEAKAMGWEGLVDGGGKSRSLRDDNKKARAKAKRGQIPGGDKLKGKGRSKRQQQIPAR
jgi:hypothetical protein